MTSTATVTERYVWVAARMLPEPQRAEFSRELRERIADTIDARIERGASAADAEHAALIELGDPAALASTYLDRPLQLIGPRYFLTWWRLLRLLLVIVVPISAAGVLAAQLIAGETVGGAILSATGTALAVAVHLGFWTTLVFAIIERTPGTPSLTTWTPEQLPPLHEEHRAGRLGDLIASVVFLGLFAAAIVWQQFGVVWFDGVRQPIPVLNADLWPFWIPYFLLLLLLEVLFAIAIYLRGWNWALAGINVVLNVAFAVPALWLFLTGRLLDPALLEAMKWPWNEAATTATVTSIVIVVIAASTWDVIDGFVKAWRGSRSRSL